MAKTGLTRRDFIGRAAAALAVPLARESRAAAPPQICNAYVGTYTPNGGGIYLFRIDRASGALTQLQVIDDIRNPSWLAMNPAQTRLYAVSQIDDYQGTRGGAVVSYAIDADSCALRRLGAVASGGGNPAYVSVHPSGKFVFAANYGGGSVAVFPVLPDGSLAPASDVRPSIGARHHGHAVDDPPGQFAVSDHEEAHVHMVAPDPTGQFVLANDAGLDLTLIWRLDAEAGRLLPSDMPVVEAPSGSAPRHFVFHPNGKYFYNLYEHDAKVAVYDYDGSNGFMRYKQTVSTLPPRFAGSNLSAEILMSPDGRFLYASNRLHDTLAVFAVAADGQLRMTSETWVHGESPLSAALDPSGQMLFSCNRRGDSITSFRVNPGTGALTFTNRFEPVGSPAVMLMLKPR